MIVSPSIFKIFEEFRFERKTSFDTVCVKKLILDDVRVLNFAFFLKDGM